MRLSATRLFATGGAISSAGGAPGPGGYSISKSIRFNSADSAYLNRTPASAGNRKTWTWAGWLKRSKLTQDEEHLWIGGVNQTTDTTYNRIYFDGSNRLRAGAYNVAWRTTTQVFRDTSAWFHLVVAVDTTQATANNRIRVYVNGAEITAFDSISNPSQNDDTGTNNSTLHYIGAESGPIRLLNGYLADVFLIDGQALDPTSFVETNAITGQLVPKAFTGSYGTNGFHLDFNSFATTAALGTDTSSNGNTWTVNNFSVTAGSGNDSLTDTPTSYGTDTGVGGSVRGNYAVLNPLSYTGTVTLSNGNLDATGSNANASSTIAPNAGKWYAEFVYSAIGSAVGFVGISNRLAADAFSGATQTWQLNYTNTGKLENAGSQSTVSTFTTGDVVGVAFDCSNGQATFYKNGSSVGTITGSAFIGVPVVFGAGAGGSSGTNTFVANFGQRAFAYTAPSGFKALVDTNLAVGTITTSGTFTGNANADGPFVYLNGVPTAMLVNGNLVTFATHADKLANGFKIRSASSLYNLSGSNIYLITTSGANFKNARAQGNP